MAAYNYFMEISLAPELEARLAKVASEAGKAANQVVREVVAHYVEHDERFRREVKKGVASLDSGRFVSHEEVGRQNASLDLDNDPVVASGLDRGKLEKKKHTIRKALDHSQERVAIDAGLAQLTKVGQHEIGHQLLVFLRS